MRAIFEVVAFIVELWAIGKALWQSRKVRKLVAGHLAESGTAAHEIELLLVTLRDNCLFVGETHFAPLLQIRESLWKLYNQLLDLEAEAQVVVGEDSKETRAAMLRFVGKKGNGALPVLEGVVNNPNAEAKAISEALAWINELKSVQAVKL